MNDWLTMFINGEIESRPVGYGGVTIWLDAENRIHRENGPAIEKDGYEEYWNHGVKK